MTVPEIQLVLNTAQEMKGIIRRDIKKVPTLRGKSIINLFFEPSTRTRTSFELAGKYLGADVVNITTSASSVVKGESLRDTLMTVEAMGVDIIVMRHEAGRRGAVCVKSSESGHHQCRGWSPRASYPGAFGYVYYLAKRAGLPV